MLTWDRALYEGQRRQDERAFAAHQRLIREAQGHAHPPVKAHWHWLTGLRARLATLVPPRPTSAPRR